MAAKKAATKPAPKATGKAMINWEEELARQADLAGEMEKHVGEGGNKIGTRGGTFNYKGEDIGDTMNVIVVTHLLENAWYENRFDSDNPMPPSCWAIGEDEETMAPHENAEAPQADACKDCEFNQYGSADTGRGKACKNTRRLAIITDGDLEDIPAAEEAYLNIPVTSAGAWATYVKNLRDNLRRPPFAVITEISMTPDPKTQFKMHFKLSSQIEDATQFEELLEKKKALEKTIRYVYPKPEEVAERRPAKPVKGGARRPTVPARPAPKGKAAVPAKPAPKGRR